MHNSASFLLSFVLLPSTHLSSSNPCFLQSLSLSATLSLYLLNWCISSHPFFLSFSTYLSSSSTNFLKCTISLNSLSLSLPHIHTHSLSQISSLLVSLSLKRKKLNILFKKFEFGFRIQTWGNTTSSNMLMVPTVIPCLITNLPLKHRFGNEILSFLRLDWIL